MIRKCCYCSKNMGEIEPLEDKSITHGVCPECEWVISAKMDLEDALRTMPDSTDRSCDAGFSQLGIVVDLVYKIQNIESFRKAYTNKPLSIVYTKEKRGWWIRIKEWLKKLGGVLYGKDWLCD